MLLQLKYIQYNCVLVYMLQHMCNLADRGWCQYVTNISTRVSLLPIYFINFYCKISYHCLYEALFNVWYLLLLSTQSNQQWPFLAMCWWWRLQWKLHILLNYYTLRIYPISSNCNLNFSTKHAGSQTGIHIVFRPSKYKSMNA